MRSKETIKIKRSIKQGFALSLFLYTICIEEFLVNIQQKKSIIGYEINNYNIKSTAYADDIGAILKTINEIREFFN